MGKLENKVAIITGGGSGIGRAIAIQYAQEGANVIIIGRKEEALKETASQNDKISYVVGDITIDENIQNLINFVKDKYGKLDILVNNAGWCPVQPLIEMTIEDYDKAFSLDVRALVNVTIKALPLIRESKGSIINLSTVGSTHRSPNLSMYTGAKAAVDNFTRCRALELAHEGVRVNAIAPGAVDTNIWNVTDLSPEDAKKHREMIESTIPCKRFAQPVEIANVATFLASEDASYINGAIIAVDGAQGAA